MLQITQSLRDGSTELAAGPSVQLMRSAVQIRSDRTLLSAGTERMLAEFGRASWVGRARQQPDKVRMVLDKVRTDGLLATIDSVQAKLAQPIALGYCNVGVVLDCGPEVWGFGRGDRVASNGPHAEVVSVPQNLCARIPCNVSDDQASFTVLGAIALQGVRLAQPTLGETFTVMGLGLIGILTAQILRAHGCRVFGVDPDQSKVEFARQFGVLPYPEGQIVDGVLITASTRSSEPVSKAALMCRKRGRIVLVGVTGLQLSRDDFYKKELSFQVSCSYGPGRYDPSYEDQGHDYPLPYVRWTAQRNFEAVLQLLSEGKLVVDPLISHRFPFERATEAYELLLSGKPHMGILLEYPTKPTTELLAHTINLYPPTPARQTVPSCPNVGVIGAGGYACKVLLPAFLKASANLISIASRSGLSAATAGRRFHFKKATTDIHSMLSDPRIDTIVIATRHDSHAQLVCDALTAGKHVFVEKPLAISADQLEAVRNAYTSTTVPRLLMVGFNRRFAPHVQRIKQLLASSPAAKSFIYTVNAGVIPPDHWTQDSSIGGGRILGEACHFIDLLRFLAASPIASVQTSRLAADTVTISLTFADGSIGSIHYFANGNKSFPKERLEVFASGRILLLDNFRSLRGHGWPGFKKMNLWRQDKGADAMAAAFMAAVREGKPSPIPFDELLEVTQATLQAATRS
ncbi:MAG: bi-domain-containing oxidoreductase [Bryobacterales bacterium]|nr:bi-domain-containing oxidoreductase [Bryobacterales bacterium]